MGNSEPYAQEGYDLMGAAFVVHNEVGGGLLEEVYQECLEIELEASGIPFLSQELLKIFYKGKQLRKYYVPDFLVYGQIVVELKACRDLEPDHESQVINYMRLARKPVGYLINFGPINEVEWNRYCLKEFLPE